MSTRATFQVPLSRAIGTVDTSDAVPSTLQSVMDSADALGTVETPTVIDFAGKARFVTLAAQHPAGGFNVRTFDGLTIRAEGTSPVLTFPAP